MEFSSTHIFFYLITLIPLRQVQLLTNTSKFSCVIDAFVLFPAKYSPSIKWDTTPNVLPNASDTVFSVPQSSVESVIADCCMIKLTILLSVLFRFNCYKNEQNAK